MKVTKTRSKAQERPIDRVSPQLAQLQLDPTNGGITAQNPQPEEDSEQESDQEHMEVDDDAVQGVPAVAMIPDTNEVIAMLKSQIVGLAANHNTLAKEKAMVWIQLNGMASADPLYKDKELVFQNYLSATQHAKARLEMATSTLQDMCPEPPRNHTAIKAAQSQGRPTQVDHFDRQLDVKPDMPRFGKGGKHHTTSPRIFLRRFKAYMKAFLSPGTFDKLGHRYMTMLTVDEYVKNDLLQEFEATTNVLTFEECSKVFL